MPETKTGRRGEQGAGCEMINVILRGGPLENTMRKTLNMVGVLTIFVCPSGASYTYKRIARDGWDEWWYNGDALESSGPDGYFLNLPFFLMRTRP